MKRWIVLFAALLLGAPAWSATCSVSEFDTLIVDANSRPVQIPLVSSPSPTTQAVTATTATAVTNAFAATTRFLWVYCDEVMHMQLGVTPATGLTTGDFRIPAGGFWIGLVRSEVEDGTLKIALCDADCA